MNTNSKLRVALFFGGVSSEHDVSCVSASAWLRALGQEPCADKYEVFPVGITKDGRWLACRPTPEAMADGSWEQGDCTPCVLSPDRKDHGIWLLKDGRAELVRIDICAPVMHGKNGEDGTIQGLFELARIPYVGCGVLGSAVCMDKAVANALMDAAGVPHCKWVAASRADLELNGPVVLDGIEAKLGYPIFVKPANAGSSVGISKAADRAALEKGVEIALRGDVIDFFGGFGPYALGQPRHTLEGGHVQRVDRQPHECHHVLDVYGFRIAQPAVFAELDAAFGECDLKVVGLVARAEQHGDFLRLIAVKKLFHARRHHIGLRQVAHGADEAHAGVLGVFSLVVNKFLRKPSEAGASTALATSSTGCVER